MIAGTRNEETSDTQIATIDLSALKFPRQAPIDYNASSVMIPPALNRRPPIVQ